MKDKDSELPFIWSFLIMSINFVSGFYFVKIEKPHWILIVLIMTIFGIVSLNNYAQRKHNKKINR